MPRPITLDALKAIDQCAEIAWRSQRVYLRASRSPNLAATTRDAAAAKADAAADIALALEAFKDDIAKEHA